VLPISLVGVASVLLRPTFCWCRLWNCLPLAAGPSQSLNQPFGTVYRTTWPLLPIFRPSYDVWKHFSSRPHFLALSLILVKSFLHLQWILKWFYYLDHSENPWLIERMPYLSTSAVRFLHYIKWRSFGIPLPQWGPKCQEAKHPLETKHFSLQKLSRDDQNCPFLVHCKRHSKLACGPLKVYPGRIVQWKEMDSMMKCKLDANKMQTEKICRQQLNQEWVSEQRFNVPLDTL